AKDLGTGKEQKITVTSSSGLSESEIKRMVDDAQVHASQDKERREVIDAKNKLDGLVFQVEKTIRENESKIPAEMKAGLTSEIEAARKVLETQSEDKAALDAAATALEQKAYKLAEEMYKSTSAEGPDAGPTPGAGSTGGAKKDGVVDAEFESN
ncbi:MAG: Hsp70 family protein, partial [Silvanigrellaceae bacterium]